MTTMLYKSPGPFKRSATETFDFCIVDDDAVDASLHAGWHLTVGEAVDAANGAVQDPEPEAKAKPKRGHTRKSEAL